MLITLVTALCQPFEAMLVAAGHMQTDPSEACQQGGHMILCISALGVTGAVGVTVNAPVVQLKAQHFLVKCQAGC